MKESQPDKVRNVVLTAHQGAGKTTLTESLLHRMGIINRMGTIDDGNTVSDYRTDEIDRKISISTTLVVGEHHDTKINILDTPGFTDFIGEVKGAVSVADISGVLIQAVSGIEVGTELVWGFADELSLPRFLYVNHLDKENVEFDALVDSLADAYGAVVPIQFPVNEGSEHFNQIVDLLTMKVVTWNQDGGEKSRADIPSELKDQADEWRQKLVDAVAEIDDKLMERYFENDGLTADELIEGLRAGLHQGKLYPLLCGSA
ncbi:MAG: GTP-binding protein, partial [Candidatus Electryoneaceae bacterium]|nr:GTP-binding protein [Candidatus Electryoneaceae bacterium]